MTLQLFAEPENEAEATSAALIAALDYEDFLCHPASQTAAASGAGLGVCFITVVTGLCCAMVSAILGLVPLWAHASLLGLVWGCVCLAGLGCSWSSHRLRMGLVTLGIGALATWAVTVLTDLPAMDNHVLLMAIFGCGWLMGVTTTPWVGNRRQLGLLVAAQSPVVVATGSLAERDIRRSAPARWSLWDLIGLTTWFAVMCWWIPRWEHPSALTLHLAPAIVGGCVLSYQAIQWTWRDHWTAMRLAWGTGLLLVVIGLSLVAAPSAPSWPARAVHALAGPLSATTAQGLCVLAVLAALRSDRYLQTRL